MKAKALFRSTCLVAPALAGIMVLGAAPPLRGGQVDNPEYKAWASFKVGSSRTLTGVHTGGFSSTKVSYPSTLVKVTADQVTLHGGGPVPAKLDQKDIKYVGEESVNVMGKTFKCKVYEMAKKTWNAASGGQKSSQGKLWISDEVPGGVVKSENQLTEPGPSEGLQYHRTETFLLSAYEAK